MVAVRFCQEEEVQEEVTGYGLQVAGNPALGFAGEDGVGLTKHHDRHEDREYQDDDREKIDVIRKPGVAGRLLG